MFNASFPEHTGVEVGTARGHSQPQHRAPGYLPYYLVDAGTRRRPSAAQMRRQPSSAPPAGET